MLFLCSCAYAVLSLIRLDKSHFLFTNYDLIIRNYYSFWILTFLAWLSFAFILATQIFPALSSLKEIVKMLFFLPAVLELISFIIGFISYLSVLLSFRK